jgi:hypothetical protein
MNADINIEVGGKALGVRGINYGQELAGECGLTVEAESLRVRFDFADHDKAIAFAKLLLQEANNLKDEYAKSVLSPVYKDPFLPADAAVEDLGDEVGARR